MITLEFIYALMGALLAGVAVVNARDATNPRRWRNAAFWGLWALSFVAGSRIPDVMNGAIVLLMVGVGGIGKLGQGTGESTTRDEREASARRWGNRLFVPALAIPAVTILGAWGLKRATMNGAPIVDPKQVTLTVFSRFQAITA